MQKLEERNTYTPTDIPHGDASHREYSQCHVRSNCGLALNVEETLSVPGLKTSSNNSDAAVLRTENILSVDAALTAKKKRHAGQDMRVPTVYVLNMRGKPLMPTKLRTDIVKLNTERRQYRRASGTIQERGQSYYSVQQVRKCNRKLFKGDRSHIQNTAERVIKGFQRFDKVLWNRTECFVFGRRKTGYFDLRKLDGTKVHASAKAKELTLLETANIFLIETLKRGTPLHTLKGVVSATSAPHGGL